LLASGACACAASANTVISEASGRTIRDRLIAFILAKPHVGRAAGTDEPVLLPHVTTRATLLTGLPRLVLLQISKIATILRQAQGSRIVFRGRQGVIAQAR
jgi:hypothetical protein